MREGPCRHPGAVQPQPHQVPHEAQGRARFQRMGAHLLGPGHGRDFGRYVGVVPEGRPEVPGHVHGRRRKPAVLQPGAFPVRVGRRQLLRARLRAVLPAAQPHGVLPERHGRHQFGRRPGHRGVPARLPARRQVHAYEDVRHVGRRPFVSRHRFNGPRCHRAAQQRHEDRRHRPASDA